MGSLSQRSSSPEASKGINLKPSRKGFLSLVSEPFLPSRPSAKPGQTDRPTNAARGGDGRATAEHCEANLLPRSSRVWLLNHSHRRGHTHSLTPSRSLERHFFSLFTSLLTGGVMKPCLRRGI